MGLYHIAGNFRGRKLSRISQIYAVPQKFSSWIFCGYGTCGRGVARNTWQEFFCRMCTQGVIDPVQHVFAQVLSDKLITTKAWWSPFDGCSFFEYRSCQQEVKQVRQAWGGRHLDTDIQTRNIWKLHFWGEGMDQETGSRIWCDSICSPLLLPINRWRKVLRVCLDHVGAPHLQARCLFSQKAGYGTWWVWLAT